MKRRSFLLVAFVGTILLSNLVTAQEQDQPGPPAVQPPSVQSQGSVDSQGIRRYQLGPGDVLDIRVFGQSDLSGQFEIDSEGNLLLPFIDSPLKATCKTDTELKQEIVEAYSKFIKSPQISVRTVGRNSRPPAIVFGAVRVPQRVQMYRKVRLSELITLSGGFTERANGNIQVLHTEAVMCPEPDEVVEPLVTDDGTLVNPFKIYKLSDLIAGKEEANPVIRPGDVVTVMEAEPVYVTGSVTSPQGIYLRENLTLTRAIAMVGGARREAKLSDVRIYRQKPGEEQEVLRVDFAAIKKKQQPDILLQAYDIIDVPESSPFSGKRILQTLAGAAMGVPSNMALQMGTQLPLRVLY